MASTCSLRAGPPAMQAAGRCCALAAGAMLMGAAAWGAEDFPPPLAAPAASASAPAGKAEGAPAAPADAAPAPAAGTAEAAAAPPAAAPKPQPDVQIEQKHVGRRVAEVVVTPAGFTYHYTMTHIEDTDPAGTLLQPHQELSVPRFFRFDFDF